MSDKKLYVLFLNGFPVGRFQEDIASIYELYKKTFYDVSATNNEKSYDAIVKSIRSKGMFNSIVHGANGYNNLSVFCIFGELKRYIDIGSIKNMI